MRETARGLAASWRGDVLLAAVLLAWAVTWLAAAPVAGSGERHWAALAFVLPWCAALAGRRRWPVLAALAACAALLMIRPLGQARVFSGLLTEPFAWTSFLLGYALGSAAGLVPGLAGAGLLIAGLQAENRVFNPVFEMIVLGSWAVGRIAWSRRGLAGRLRARNAELRAEQELFAQEAVRYERARIARELHDIVAHCLSVMVVQASAGQRVPPGDRDAIAEALTSVAGAAAQAQGEIGRLAGLLSGDLPAGAGPGLPMVAELARRAAGAGLDVTCRIDSGEAWLGPAASETAYRVVQEALTNALKHAPGAPVTVTVTGQCRVVTVSVLNLPARQPPSGLEHAGGQYGLTAMRDRVAACGGSLTTGPTPAGGWQVVAVLPVEVKAEQRPAVVSRRPGRSSPAARP
jgi:signal transduction histidine kinase